jgi:hypothetical protein
MVPLARWIGGLCVGLLARWNRWQGHYDRRTLRLHWSAWHRTRQPAQLMRLALFRRDLGYALPSRWGRPLAHHLASGKLRSADQRRLADLLSADRADACAEMQAHRVEFERWLEKRLLTFDSGSSGAGICVVGNAGSLRGWGGGAVIDAHAVVVRFNHWHDTPVDRDDTGARADIWVVSPAYQGRVPDGLAWAVVTGPDPHASLSRWPVPQALQRAGVPVLTVPLAVWRDLVLRLEAPPTAGVLMLAWLHALRGNWTDIGCVGVGTGDAGKAHHIVSGARPGRRHAWLREQSLVKGWQARGLHLRQGVFNRDAPGL